MRNAACPEHSRYLCVAERLQGPRVSRPGRCMTLPDIILSFLRLPALWPEEHWSTSASYTRSTVDDLIR